MEAEDLTVRHQLQAPWDRTVRPLNHPVACEFLHLSVLNILKLWNILSLPIVSSLVTGLFAPFEPPVVPDNIVSPRNMVATCECYVVIVLPIVEAERKKEKKC